MKIPLYAYIGSFSEISSTLSPPVYKIYKLRNLVYRYNPSSYLASH